MCQDDGIIATLQLGTIQLGQRLPAKLSWEINEFAIQIWRQEQIIVTGELVANEIGLGQVMGVSEEQGADV